jgi:hypothetical protein
MAKKKLKTSLFYTSVVAGLIYSSWPLGYWLNPAVSMSSLASGLEAVGQPYNWLFILMDVISSVLVIIICYLLWRMYGRTVRARPIFIALVCLVLFSVGTIADALIPERCVPNFQQCPNFRQDHILLIHGIFSILASLFLFLSFCIVWFYQRRLIIMNVFLIGYILFGLITGIEAVAPGNNGNWSQHYFITLCSGCLICIPYAIGLMVKSEPPN